MIETTFRVGKRKVTTRFPKPEIGSAYHMEVQWEPTVPQRLNKKEIKQYRSGRDAALSELLKLMGGGNGLVVEV